MTAADQHVSLEDSEDALLEGDRPIATGTAMTALRHRTFRTVFIGAFLSNVGSWMQNAVLMGYAFTLTHSAGYVGLHVFGASSVFTVNAVTYLFVIAALLRVRLPPPVSFDSSSARGLRQLFVGVQVARHDKVVGRSLVTIFTFSAFALTFVGQLAVV